MPAFAGAGNTAININPNGAVTHCDPVTSINFPPVAISVKEFGATGNGVTDDSAAINTALSTLVSSGLALFFPAGTYLCTTNTIVGVQNVQIIVGSGAVFSGTNASQMLQSQPGYARNIVSSLQAYGGSGTNVLTESSNGAWAAQDGVTNVVGDTVFIQGGTTNLTAAKDSGPWVITSLGGASAKWVLQRPAWFATGMNIPQAFRIELGGEGTGTAPMFAGTSWKAMCASGKIVGTDDPTFYPGRIGGKFTLTASTVTITTLPIFAAAATQFLCQFQLAHGTTTSTIGYGVIAAPTPGYTGTASAVVDALASGMGKNGSADASDLIVTAINW